MDGRPPRSNPGKSGPFLSIRVSLFLAFAVLVLAGGGISALIGWSITSEAVVGEAQRRVEQDLQSAWALYDHARERVSHAVQTVALLRRTQEALQGQGTHREDLTRRLEAIRKRNGLDFLTLADREGRVVIRTRPPYQSGDRLEPDPVRDLARRTGNAGGTVRLQASALAMEGEDLAAQAAIEVRPTAMASSGGPERVGDGLVIEVAETVLDEGGGYLGMVVGGILWNRNHLLLDGIRETLFRNEFFQGSPVGTVTLFLGDVRVVTNVRDEAGGSAVGTRLSKAVKEVVLDQGQPFRDRAFVVKDWYLTAYDPIRDPNGEVIGILYVGLLESRFLAYRTRLIQGFLILTGIGVLASLLFGLGAAWWLSRPLRNLTETARRMADLDLSVRAGNGGPFQELQVLNRTFNRMAENLDQASRDLQRANGELQRANEDLSRLNHNYMDMLEFVTHELKSPLASCLFGVGSLKDGLVGQPSPEQRRVLETIERNLEYLNEMILNYLNLSRIEKDQLRFSPKALRFRAEVLDPALEQVSRQIYVAGIYTLVDVPEDLVVEGDRDLLRIVMDNLLSNAVKYGRPNSTLRVLYEPGPDGAHRFCVHNEGMGFRPEEGRRLFQKFSRLDVAELRAKRGTGLGLFITQQIVQRHGGRIWAESEFGRDARFWFELPARVPGPPGETP